MKKLRQEDAEVVPESLRKGHRLRLRQRIIQSAGGTISELELLEYLLFGTHPRIDVKPLAKSLLKEFGDFKKLFAADHDDLKSVSGVNDAVVALIKTVRESMKAILRKDLTSRTTLKSWKSVVDYLRLSIGNNPVETIRSFFLTRNIP
ncbi:DNA repair protein RadC [Neorickettsia risticii str. Illinois]|uniref:DNA repair protein RadC n=1 Tax=Neorickettsia risticii (strain Illinois) TaxID=434131 RepID=C6V497_NEORI|nr:hypothetical protein [Neorickettsia risticii]ACT69217.1 DNA repair protein RadC [Neorickettsia risticii str. Illinois]